MKSSGEDIVVYHVRVMIVKLSLMLFFQETHRSLFGIIGLCNYNFFFQNFRACFLLWLCTLIVEYNIIG